MSDFWGLVSSGGIDKDQRYLILRHDIDSDVAKARRFVEINNKLNVRSTFYLRLNTFDSALIADILDAKLDLGYHFEELSDAAIESGWSNVADVDIHECRRRFIKNLKSLRENYSIPIDNICSHGEFANRSLGVTNNYFLDDKFLKEAGIRIDAYSPDLRDAIDAFVSDTFPPQKYIPHDPKIHFKSGTQVVQILVHPRHWGGNLISNAKLDSARVFRGIKYFINKILK
ncbi:hypothetical protein LSUCC0246_10005 [Rhodobacterales bacterium LSUCC0246]|nr:hypothetical protein [Rhodobacterales bacterium LSUCC0374]